MIVSLLGEKPGTERAGRPARTRAKARGPEAPPAEARGAVCLICAAYGFGMPRSLQIFCAVKSLISLWRRTVDFSLFAGFW